MTDLLTLQNAQGMGLCLMVLMNEVHLAGGHGVPGLHVVLQAVLAVPLGILIMTPRGLEAQVRKHQKM